MTLTLRTRLSKTSWRLFALPILLLPVVLVWRSPGLIASAYHGRLTAQQHQSTTNHFPHVCIEAPGADKVLVIVKTGSSEIYQRLSHHFNTLLGCVTDFMIFSDVAQSFGPYQVLDALAAYDFETRQKYSQFRAYEQLNLNHKLQQDNSKSVEGAWDLDKWKFLPITRQAYAAYPEQDWYLFMDADTSLSWTNVLQYLHKLNSSKALYLGNPAYLNIPFAHGGSGYVISNAAMKIFEAGYEQHKSKWIEYTGQTCCGDHALALMMEDVGISVSNTHPAFEGAPLRLVDFWRERWCIPPVTFHHLNSGDIDMLWQFQEQWVGKHGWSVPYMARDIFEALVEPHLAAYRKDWNNESRDLRYGHSEWEAEHEGEEKTDLAREATKSLEACLEACEGMEDCMQYKYKHGKCYLNKSIILGQREDGELHDYEQKGEDQGPRWKSGWMMDRIGDWKFSMSGCEMDWGFAGNPVYKEDHGRSKKIERNRL